MRWEIIFPVFLVFPAYGEPTFLDFLVEFIDADGGNLAVNLFECGKSDSVKMAKKFMYHGFLTDAVFIDSVQETFPLRPGRQFFAINLSCNNSINLLNQGKIQKQRSRVCKAFRSHTTIRPSSALNELLSRSLMPFCLSSA